MCGHWRILMILLPATCVCRVHLLTALVFWSCPSSWLLWSHLAYIIWRTVLLHWEETALWGCVVVHLVVVVWGSLRCCPITLILPLALTAKITVNYLLLPVLRLLAITFIILLCKCLNFIAQLPSISYKQLVKLFVLIMLNLLGLVEFILRIWSILVLLL